MPTVRQRWRGAAPSVGVHWMKPAMVQLYPEDKHCPLRDEAWSPEKVGAGIREILQQSVNSFEPKGLWPRHPLDGDGPVRTDYYFGAGGVFWGVSLLSREGWIEEPEGWFG